ncbi:hypothetical protein SESBI_06700 [Sesbania bispinosa]|nr:hypothetical protein SESBI_06700 [Sesbania bispinosa]
MSRHRRQPSQAIPSEIISGEDLSKPFDLPHFTITEDGGGSKSTTTSLQATHKTNQEIKEFPLATSPPANPKNPPPEKSA